ncbi:nuclease-related domain-containing protein [Bacillus canaveralius]|uniref:nuclease-related domain-containing protein n=1 Tax=Bacillus canaveralius TaxID=1403243 RepID=UPI0035E3E0B0
MGSRAEKQWTVNRKYKMMNPFHQNFGHIQTVKQALQLYSDNTIFSVISFTRKAIFRIEPEPGKYIK